MESQETKTGHFNKFDPNKHLIPIIVIAILIGILIFAITKYGRKPDKIKDRFDEIENGMTSDEVREICGEPDSEAFWHFEDTDIHVPRLWIYNNLSNGDTCEIFFMVKSRSIACVENIRFKKRKYQQ